jgi:ParB-like chromosome segregation protein Spo0J
MTTLKMTVEDVPVEELHFDPANVRKHPEENLAQIRASLARFGQQKPIVVGQGNVVIAGNGFLTAAKSLGWRTVKVVRTNLAGSEATAYAIADNRTAELAEWDEAALQQQLAAIAIDDEELLAATGFDEKELAKLSAQIAPEINEDEVPEPPAEPITQPGDLWLLGKHRLLCGDSTKAENVNRLMDGEKADLCFTSPPYALGKSVALRGNTAMASKQRVYDKHDDNPDEWAQLMDGWWDASFQAVSNAWMVNVQPLAGNKRDLMRWINSRVDRLIDIVTWDKGHAAPQMAPGVLASRYEWIIGFGKPEASRAFPLSSWRGTLQSVYEAPPQRDNEFADIHAATMPVHVPAWIMGTLCDQAKSVYEPFCGTGTTLIAAEQLGRTCYGMEISPAYCDVIVKRWETLTGQKAERKV